MSPALAGRFFTTEPPGKPLVTFLKSNCFRNYFPSGSVVKNPPADVGYAGSIPGLRSSSGEGNSSPHQCSYLGNSMDRGAWRTIVHGVKESDRTEQLNNNKTNHSNRLCKIQNYFISKVVGCLGCFKGCYSHVQIIMPKIPHLMYFLS